MLGEIKRILRIDWDYEDDRLKDILIRSIAKIETITGKSFNENDEALKSLVLNHARYDYNNVAELFDENFRSDIFIAQVKVATDEFKTESKKCEKDI